MPHLYLPERIAPAYKTLIIKKKKIEVAEIIVEGSEYEVCDEFSSKMWASKKKGKWGAGLINTEDDKNRAERVGLLGEMAFSKISGLPVNIEYYEGGKDHDFCTEYKIDVKTAARKPKYNCGLIRGATESRKDLILKSDLYIFGYVEKDLTQEKSSCIILVGGEYRENITKGYVRRAKLGYHYNYEVGYADLIPIRGLLLLI